MNENSCTKVTTISHESEMDDERHPDTETSRLVVANYFRQTVLTAKQVFLKISQTPANRLTLTNPFLW